MFHKLNDLITLFSRTAGPKFCCFCILYGWFTTMLSSGKYSNIPHSEIVDPYAKIYTSSYSTQNIAISLSDKKDSIESYTFEFFQIYWNNNQP